GHGGGAHRRIPRRAGHRPRLLRPRRELHRPARCAAWIGHRPRHLPERGRGGLHGGCRCQADGAAGGGAGLARPRGLQRLHRRAYGGAGCGAADPAGRPGGAAGPPAERLPGDRLREHVPRHRQMGGRGDGCGAGAGADRPGLCAGLRRRAGAGGARPAGGCAGDRVRRPCPAGDLAEPPAPLPGRGWPSGRDAAGSGAADPACRPWLRGRRGAGGAPRLRRGLAGAGRRFLPAAGPLPQPASALCGRSRPAEPGCAAGGLRRGGSRAGAGDAADRHHDTGLVLAGAGAAAGPCLRRPALPRLALPGGAGGRGRCAGDHRGAGGGGAGRAGRARGLGGAAARPASLRLPGGAARLAGWRRLRRGGEAHRAGGAGGCHRHARCRHLRRTLLPQDRLDAAATTAGARLRRDGLRRAGRRCRFAAPSGAAGDRPRRRWRRADDGGRVRRRRGAGGADDADPLRQRQLCQHPHPSGEDASRPGLGDRSGQSGFRRLVRRLPGAGDGGGGPGRPAGAGGGAAGARALGGDGADLAGGDSAPAV
ncbi:MAG: Thiamine pyrophosphate-requiring enzymes, partial [uncultured Craurococcus sp.]